VTGTDVAVVVVEDETKIEIGTGANPVLTVMIATGNTDDETIEIATESDPDLHVANDARRGLHVVVHQAQLYAKRFK